MIRLIGIRILIIYLTIGTPESSFKESPKIGPGPYRRYMKQPLHMPKTWADAQQRYNKADPFARQF
jgi:hypothetical protein